MAVATNELQILWSAASSLSIAAAGTGTSDAITASVTALAAQIQLKADNNGTPASGDTVDFYWLPSLGDPDGASTEEYDTPGHAMFLARLDTNTADPSIVTVPLPTPFLKGKVYAVNNSAGRAITVSAIILETTG